VECRPEFLRSELAPTEAIATTFWITDDHIVYMNSSFWTHICTRQQDGSWIETDGFAFNSSITDYTLESTVYFNGYDTVVFTFPKTTLEGEEDPNESAMVVECKVPQNSDAETIFATKHTLDLLFRATEEKRTPETKIEQTILPLESFPTSYTELSNVYNQKIALLRTVQNVMKFKNYIANFNVDRQ
jgi:hypothetical protein